MFCKSGFSKSRFLNSSLLAIALGVAAIASAAVPAAADYVPVRGNIKFEASANPSLPGTRMRNAEMPMPTKKSTKY
jgi:hypothetical protein